MQKKQSDKPKWQARNLPNDELDLQIPIFDTDIAYLDNNHIAAITAYGEIREYDIRGQRRPIVNTLVGTEKAYLSKIVQSRLNPNIVYVANQEGHLFMLDRKHNYRIVRKLVGSRGSIRALAALVVDSDKGPQEYLLSGGCDRHVRVFDPNCDIQKNSEVAHCYVKQKVNSILVTPPGKFKE